MPVPGSAWRRAGFFLLTGLAFVAAAGSAAIWITGGFAFRVGGLRISASDPLRAFAVAAVTAVIAVWWAGPRAMLARVRGVAVSLLAPHAALALACATTITGLAYGSWTASGADAYAYLSQAALWRDGALSAPVPLARDAPWPEAVTTFAPFGYRAALDGRAALVPITAPGIPMLIAALQSIAGHGAAFLVTPLAGGVLVFLTFALGRRTSEDSSRGVSVAAASANAVGFAAASSNAVGFAAAWLVATSPAVLFMLMWPMTDVPAAACAAFILWAALGTSTRSAAAAGLVASFGILTRPTFIAIAAGVGAWFILEHVVWRVRRFPHRVVAYALGAVPGAVVMAWLNSRWYGSPLAVGYGAAGDLLSWAHVAANGSRYVRWLAASSPLGLVGLTGLLCVVWPLTPVWPTTGSRRAAWAFAAVTGATFLPYLLYGDFHDWWYLRFLLPAWPAMFVAAAMALRALATRGRLAAALVIAVVVTAGAAGVWTARARGVFAFGERRYATVAQLVALATEADAVILTNHHAGTIQYYGGRVALRWDVLDAAWLDRAVAWLRARGRHAYILVEDWEQPLFEARFGGANVLGHLTFSPALAWQSIRGDGWIWLYDPDRRDAPTIRPGPEVERQLPFSPAPSASIWPR